jgi:translation initiation factor 1 (eIF-1/SUI1)
VKGELGILKRNCGCGCHIEVHIKLIQWEINELAGDSSQDMNKLLEKIKSSLLKYSICNFSLFQ